MEENSKEQILNKIKDLYPNDKFKINEFSFKDNGKNWYYTMNSLNNCLETLNEIIQSEDLNIEIKEINMELIRRIKESISSGKFTGEKHSDIFWPKDREFQSPELEKSEDFVSESAKERAKNLYEKHINNFKETKNKVLKKIKNKEL